MKRILFAITLVLIVASCAFGVLTKKNGSADNTVYFYVTDPNGDPNTAIGITDLDIYYIEQGAAMAAKVDMTALAAADSAHADNKGFHCGQGILRVDFPDGAFDGGIGKTVELLVRDVTGATDDGQKDKIFPITVQLGAYSDAEYLAGSATPITNLNNVYNTAWATVFDDTNDLWNVRLMEVSASAGVMSTADVRGAVRYQTEAAIATDANDNSMAANSEDLARMLMAETPTTVAVVTDAGEFTITAGNTTDDYYNQAMIVVQDVTDGNRRSVRFVRDYTGATRKVFTDEDFPFLPAAADPVYIYNVRAVGRGRVSP